MRDVLGMRNLSLLQAMKQGWDGGGGGGKDSHDEGGGRDRGDASEKHEERSRENTSSKAWPTGVLTVSCCTGVFLTLAAVLLQLQRRGGTLPLVYRLRRNLSSASSGGSWRLHDDRRGKMVAAR